MQKMSSPAKLAALLFAGLLLPASGSAQTVLRYTDHEPLGGMRTRFIKDVFFAAVEKESAGRLKIKDQWNSELSTGYNALATIGAGKVADIGIVVPEYKDEAMPLHQIFKSFPVGPTGARQVAFFREVYGKVPAFAAELDRNNVVNILFTTGYPVAFFSTKPFKNLADIKGNRWRSASFWHKDFLANAGAIPVTMRWGPEVFNAMKARTLDGLMVNVDSGYMLKVHEVAPQVLASKDLWLGHVYLLTMNKNVWNGLARQDKDAIGRAAEASYKLLGPIMDKAYDEQMADLKKAGVGVRQLSATEVTAFARAAKYEDVQAAWVKKQEARGVKDAGAVMSQVHGLINASLK